MPELLQQIKNKQFEVYEASGLTISNFTQEQEGQEYYANTCLVNNKNAIFRVAKKTPTKTGYFVAIWKRNKDKITAPYDKSDLVDFIIICIINGNRIGQFIFPKSVLIKNKIMSVNDIGGKRGIRVYSPWDDVNSAQAIKTQKWQIEYFVELTSNNTDILRTIKNLYTT